VRRWRSWYRWVTLAMLAHAFLVVAAVTEHAGHPPPSGLIGLTCNEVQHLFAALVAVPSLTPDPGCAGRCGDDDSKPAPGAATTGNSPADHEDRDLPGPYSPRLPVVAHRTPSLPISGAKMFRTSECS
jgi:hypothetical protein